MVRRPDSDAPEDAGPLFRRPLPPATPAEVARDAAIERVGAAADDGWQAAAWAALRAVAALGADFTTDEVWAAMGDAATLTHEPRAMGAVMAAASRAGICRATGAYRKSESVACHARPKAVWACGA